MDREEEDRIIRKERELKEQDEHRRKSREVIMEKPGEYIAKLILFQVRDTLDELPKRFEALGLNMPSLRWFYFDHVHDLLKFDWQDLSPEKKQKAWEIVTDIADYVRSQISDWLDELRAELDSLFDKDHFSGAYKTYPNKAAFVKKTVTSESGRKLTPYDMTCEFLPLLSAALGNRPPGRPPQRITPLWKVYYDNLGHWEKLQEAEGQLSKMEEGEK